ncbi:16S rRNA (adenine(1518)-N(6)/adenine(1519)-N(6))-dimethyltransferase RsmA [Pectinatus cerevisiiphilus]|uniref:Ribosomal RNA small subunit methyltransferase A n=1 Tax=Pectinatus cerevisiiphilus TaxID=86956 RepID=A0A4R3K248_9FIRM|nr:16S rRNA (adenine(1518)-N(6)/adenine(1519)-N(6))-dimethyltransferase RsmA [Pectinatus cerevisiiphilus]TCS76175.1 16S rRNA (adenine1518-N6/adenine1519-N6)-dimethyltransferase [Pectinatus cerevisiiphilus]
MEQPIIAKREVTRYILKRFGLHMNKKLGQNFLVDEDVVHGVVDAAEINENDVVLEIGPGIGTLTQGLLEAGAEVFAVELDKRLPPILEHTLEGYDKLHIINADILKTDIKALIGDRPFKVAANLPYYITTPIIMYLLEAKLPITGLVTMVQKEVAERMTAIPGNKIYGALSVAVQYYSHPQICFDVAPQSFMPKPEVVSSVILCKVYDERPIKPIDEKMFFRVVKASFGQRRKTLSNSLGNLGVAKEIIKEVLEESAIDGKRRGETLSLQEFAVLADNFSKKQFI